MTDKEKIEKILNYFGLSAKKFSEKIGLESPNPIYYVQRNRNNLSKELAKKICITYSELNLNWLLTGEGEMLKDNTNSSVFGNKINGNSNITGIGNVVNKSEYTEIEHYKQLLMKKDEELQKKEDQITDMRKQIIDLIESIKNLTKK